MDVGAIITWITTNLDLITQIVGVAALIATLTPNESDNAIVDAILRAINFTGANLGNARNAPVESADTSVR